MSALRRARGLLRRGSPPVLLAAWVVAMASAERWPSGDGPHLLGTAMRLANALRAGAPGAWADGMGTLVGPHPPGAYVLPTAVAAVLGPGFPATHLVVGALVLWLTWDGVRRLGGGLVSALVLASCGLVWVQADNAGVDLLAGACVVQSVSWLVASDRLRDARAATWWGAWLGAGFVVKYTAPVFLVGPCVVAGWWVVRHGRWGRLLRAVGAFAVVGGAWYATHLRRVVGYLGESGNASSALLTNRDLIAGPWWAAERLGWYPAALADAWGLPAAAAVVFAVLTGLLGRRPAGAWGAPLLAALGGWLALNAQIQRQDRYLAPAVPLLAAAAGAHPVGWLALPALGLGAYGTAAIYATWRDVPSSRDYAHAWPPHGGGFPWPHEAYLPVSQDPGPWELDRAVAAMATAHGAETGTVALMLDDKGDVPSFGGFLSAVTRAGHRWDLATVHLMDRGARAGQPPPAAVFVGPFTTDDWPSRDFRVLFTILPATDRRRTAWIAAKGLAEVDAWDLPKGQRARLFVVPEGRPPVGPDPLPEMGAVE